MALTERLRRSCRRAEVIAAELGTTLSEMMPVRLVSHHMRLLGLLHRANDRDTLVLVDFDKS